MKSQKSIHETDEFLVVSDIASPEFEEVIDIYLQAFPENERQPLDKIKRRVATNEYSLLVVKRGNTVVGFSLLYVFDDLRFGLLDYMTIREEYGNLGIGAELFRQTYEYFKKGNPSRNFLLLEVEHPAYGSVSERALRLRRIRFYERLGVRTVANFEYLLPPMSDNRPTEMLLMVYAGNNSIDIDQNTLKDILVAVYEKVYNRKLGDPYLSRMLGMLSSNSRIKLE
jgi:ribosomal protein S18 acetylase RimI-like enzyme